MSFHLLKFSTTITRSSDNPASGLPRFSVFLIGSRVEGALRPVVAGFIFDPATGNRRRWAVTPHTLKKASFMVKNLNCIGFYLRNNSVIISSDFLRLFLDQV